MMTFSTNRQTAFSSMAQTDPPERMAYSIREAATVASIGRTTIYKLIGDGKLPIVKIGNRTLILADDLKQLMLSNRLH